MYAGQVDTVPLPTTGHLHILKNGYVYWENDARWDSVLKRPVDSRRAIGKLDPNNRTRMYPNKNYYELFADTSLPGDFGSVLSYGPYAALRAAAERTGCLERFRLRFRAIGKSCSPLRCMPYARRKVVSGISRSGASTTIAVWKNRSVKRKYAICTSRLPGIQQRLENS